MTKVKYIIMVLIVFLLLLLIPSISNADVEVTRYPYSNNGSNKYEFTGLQLDSAKDYEFGLTKTQNEEVKNWHSISERTDTTATVNLTGGTTEFIDVITAVKQGYITIREQNQESNIIVNHYPIDLSIPYLQISNYTVINNGKEFGTGENYSINVNFWNAGNSQAYYQYEKITDEEVISRYKEIKAQNGNFNDLQPLLKTETPSTNWNTWNYWNGHLNNENGYGYPESPISAPDSGLYYMWIYFAGNKIRDLYGYILVDNLQPEIALDRISLPSTAEVELGKTLTLKPTFSPANTTNKIVTWSSSDESVATVDNNGTITAKKIGSTIITVTSQDGNKQASCTVTVVEKLSNSNNNNGSTANGKDDTTATTRLPYTGAKIGLIILLFTTFSLGIFYYFKNKRYKDI